MPNNKKNIKQKNYYDSSYFDWQKKAGLYGATQDSWMYQRFITKNDTILDFGCGGGYMLEKLRSAKKYGVDINDIALEEARKKGLTVYRGLETLPQRLKFDVIISHHTLEHTENPAEILHQLKRYLKPKGKLILVVPIDDWRNQKKYVTNDINNHLYTWTPLLLGNLFKQCGYRIKQVEILGTAWLPLSRYYYTYIPQFIYHPAAILWGAIIRSRQIRIVGTL